MEFQVGDNVILKVLPWKWVVHFGKRGKLNPRYVRRFKVLEKVRAVAYKLELPQESIKDGRVDIQTKNACYGGNANRNAGRQNRNQAFNAGNGNDKSNQTVQRVPRTESTLGKANVQCYNFNENGHYARDCQKPRVHDAKYFREQMLLAMKDEAGSNLKDEENDFMLDNSYGDETLEELVGN
ncbi:retrovirus-related pol polyprotein from transposon TNT 1-94 [Tanacetum coccineum]